jgi:hypothetical protein
MGRKSSNQSEQPEQDNSSRLDPLDVPEYERFLESAQAPELKPVAFYGIMKDIVACAIKDTEATPAAVGLNILTQFAGRFGRLGKLCIGDDTRICRYYALVIGLSSKGRKGVSSAFPHMLFDRVDELLPRAPGLLNCPGLTRPHLSCTVTSGEGIINMLRDASRELNTKGEPLHPAVPDKRLIIDLSEFAVLLTMAARNGNTCSSILRDAFDGRPLHTMGRMDPLAVQKPHICLIGSITPIELMAKLSEVEMANGLMNRFVCGYSMKEKTIAFPNPTEPETIDTLAIRMLQNVANLTQGQPFTCDTEPLFAVDFSLEAVPVWRIYYEEMGNYEYASVICDKLCSRMELHTWMTAALLAMMNGERQISRDCLFAALAWTEYSRDTIEFLFASREAVAEARITAKLSRKILENVIKRDSFRVPLSAVREDVRTLTLFTDDRFERALNSLLFGAPPRLYCEVFTRKGVKPVKLLSMPEEMAALGECLHSDIFPKSLADH